jgi:ABC-type sugar transport system permease subunit
MVGPQQISFGEVALLFICQEHSLNDKSEKTLPSVLLFPLLLLVFVFTLVCIQIFLYLFIKVYFCLWTMLGFPQRVGLKKSEWCWKREKALCKKVVQEGACVDCGLGFFMPCLMSF